MLVMRAPEGLWEIVIMKSQPSPGRFLKSTNRRHIFQFNKSIQCPEHTCCYQRLLYSYPQENYVYIGSAITFTFMTFMNSTGHAYNIHTYNK